MLSFFIARPHLVMNTMRDMAIRQSVCLSVSSGHAGVLAKRLNVSSKFLLLSDSQCTFLVPLELNSKHHNEIRTGLPLTGASNDACWA